MLSTQHATQLAQEAKSELVSLTQELIRTPTSNPPGEEEKAAAILLQKFTSEGIAAELIPEGPGRADLVARLKGAGGPALLFDGHLDTVPPGEEAAWTHPPYSGVLDKGRIYGRGTSDMKGGIAAQVMAAVLAKRTGIELAGDLIVAATCGEEIDNLGAHTLRNAGGLEGVGAIVIAEPSNNEIFIAEKGALWLEVTTSGRTAHGSMPNLGINAIWKMHAFMDKMKDFKPSQDKHPLLGEATFSLNTMDGGFKTNVVPDRCTTTWDGRTIPGKSHSDIVAAVQDQITQLKSTDPDFKGEIKVIKDLPSVDTPPDNPLVKIAQQIGEELWGRQLTPGGVNYYTDAAVLVPGLNIPFIILGPGEPGLAHQPNENVEVEKLVAATAFYLLLAHRWQS
ncbi:MAG TPA: M20 family metallopeptidase [Firmicutes bacterium]|nr:M20 family metallopeptidase [Bacillota bacterium]